jgi:methyltransferase (TIGR00027 family)
MHPVAMTARGAAAQRARESERPDRLICDPWARALAGDEGFAMLELFERRHPRIWDDAAQACVAIHTRFFDDIARRVSDEGVRQVVLVGAGMDTRAFRLVWPVGTSLYELDRSELLDLKEEVLRRAGAQAGCRRVPLAVDLERDWVPTLLAAGFVEQEPSLWLAEAFFYYLEEQSVHQVLAQLSGVAAPGSRLGADLPSRSLLAGPWMQEALRSLEEREMAWRFGTDDPEGLLAEHGWQAQVTETGDESANYGRWPHPVPPRMDRGPPRTFLVVARKQ